MGFEQRYNIKEGDWNEDSSKTIGVFILSPKHRTARLWNLFIALTSLLAFSVSMFRVFFTEDLELISTIYYCLDFIFLLNIISCFFVGYEKDGVVITDASNVRRRYLHTWFIVDVCSLIPLEMFSHFWSLNRCLRVLRLFSIINSFGKEPDTNKIHVAALKSFCIMTICIQLSACLWHYNVCESSHSKLGRICQQDFNWLQLIPEISTNLDGISDMTFFGNAIYWSVITLSNVGYGDIYGTNTTEVKLAALVMVIGFLAIAGVIMTGMSSIIGNLDAQRGRFYSRIDAIRIHMIYGIASGDSNMEISTARYKPLLKKTSIFEDTGDGFIRALNVKLSTSTYSQGQILAKPGEMNRNAFYIENGLVQVYGDNDEKIATLLPGTLIGEVYLVYKIPRNATISASTLCEICVLEHKDLISLLADYPEAGLKIARAARTRLHNVKYPLSEAFALGLASNPQSVVFHQNCHADGKPKDQKISNVLNEFISHQLKDPSSSSTDNQKIHWIPTFRPDDRFAKSWNIIILWCVIVSIFTESWVLFFANNLETGGFYYKHMGLMYLLLSVLIDCVALIDIFINLRIEVMTKDGYSTDFISIFNNYRKSWNLYFDVLAIFPFDFFSFVYTGELHWRNLTYFRLNRLLWIRKVYCHFKKSEKDLDNDLFVQRSAKCIFLLIFILHVCSGCLYLAGCSNYRCDEDSWAWNTGLKETQSNFYHYMVAVYWATTTMTNIGYGDILPSSMTEKLVAGMVGLVGLFMFNYIVSQIYATLSAKNASR
ncbi:potassium channel KAT4-like isoform X2 [Clupea harengus]|uniref:Potassium channel KAT4-like isoform X2 n=1 Tax=Clupea harengus TaxID=7950 RepID=A0A6P8GDP7_CLUHA|nr:potassium channel KAT4-like isoform X2 [Clupea harengus]